MLIVSILQVSDCRQAAMPQREAFGATSRAPGRSTSADPPQRAVRGAGLERELGHRHHRGVRPDDAKVVLRVAGRIHQEVRTFQYTEDLRHPTHVRDWTSVLSESCVISAISAVICH